MLGSGMMDGLGRAAMGFMRLWMLVPLAAVIGALWLVAAAANGRLGHDPSEEAQATLQRRLAAGDISVEQYEQARTALGLSHPRGTVRR